MSAPCAPARGRHYPSDTSDAEWALIEPLLPQPACNRPSGGRPEKHPRRDIMDAIRYITDSGAKWAALPADFPNWKTVHGFFTRWQATGVLDHVHDQLREQVRRHHGHHPRPSAAIIDAQAVRAAETVDASTRGYDAGKRVAGRKRHIAVDTLGLLLTVIVTGANAQDRPTGKPLLSRLHQHQPGIRHVWADGGYNGPLADWAHTTLGLTLEIVPKPTGQRGFTPLPRRWVVERTLSWISQARRNTRDYERRPEHSRAFIYTAMITTMTRRLTRNT